MVEFKLDTQNSLLLPKTFFSTSFCLANTYSFFILHLNVPFSRRPSWPQD